MKLHIGAFGEYFLAECIDERKIANRKGTESKRTNRFNKKHNESIYDTLNNY